MSPEEFERQVERIYRLLEQDGEVTWNDHILDPADGGTRQIDITVRRGALITLIECRHRNKPQDKRWIEELFGRRCGVKADAVIAVSSSGYSRGAVKKAKQLGVLVRTLSEVSTIEVVAWSSLMAVNVVFIEFKALKLHANVPAAGQGEENSFIYDGSPLDLGRIYQTLADQADDHLNVDGSWMEVRGRLVGNFAWGRYSIPELAIESYVRKRVQKEIVHVRLQMVGHEAESTGLAIVEKSEVLEWIKSDHAASCAVDLSSVAAPPNCLFKSIVSEHSSGVVLTQFSAESGGKLAQLPPSATVFLHFV